MHTSLRYRDAGITVGDPWRRRWVDWTSDFHPKDAVLVASADIRFVAQSVGISAHVLDVPRDGVGRPSEASEVPGGGTPISEPKTNTRLVTARDTAPGTDSQW